MQLGECLEYEEKSNEEDHVVPDATPPHFVYQNMSYFPCENTQLDALPNGFHEVGVIKKNIVLLLKTSLEI